MVTKGYRVTPLTDEGAVPDEIGQVHHFSTSIERSEWWAVRLPTEDVQYVPDAFDYAMNGYAIMEIEAINVEDDRFSPGVDYKGTILSSKEVRVVCYRARRKSLWERVRGIWQRGA